MPLTWTPTSELAWTVYQAGFSYDPAQDIIYSRMNARQRDLGYGFGYDRASVMMSSVLDCEPIFFDHDDKHWMIELWKGQYGLETGCEIGVYVRRKNAPAFYSLLDRAIGDRGDAVPSHNLFYDCAQDAERLELTATLQRDGQTLFTRGPEVHWWLTGFRWGLCSDPGQLSVRISIAFKDEAMRTAFEGGISGRDYADYTVEGNTVSFTFARPFTTPPPVSFEALKAAQVANRLIVAEYDARSRPDNDPNHVRWALLRYVGLGYLNTRYVRGQTLLERAIEVGRAADGSLLDIESTVKNAVGADSDTVARWLFNSQPITTPPAGPRRYIALRLTGEALGAESNAQPKQDSYSCMVTIDNSRGFSDMFLSRYSKRNGLYEISPPSLIPRGEIGRLVLASNHEQSGGSVTYTYCDASLEVKTVRLSFETAQGRPSTGGTTTRPIEWRCIQNTADPTFPQTKRELPGSFYFRFVTQEHREVAGVRKNSDGTISHLCGRPGTYWAPATTANVVDQITSGEVTYFLRSQGKEISIRVVHGAHGQYLRAAGRAGASLRSLPVC